MASSRVIPWSGPLLMLGGALWIAWAIVHALQPMGCVADECSLPGRSMRQGSALGSALLIAAVLALAVGVWGLVRRARARGGFGRLGSIGLIASAAGVGTVVIAGLVQAVFYHGDFWAMPYFVIPAALALVVGFVLLGVAIMRSGVLPRWVAALLIIATLAMLGMNEQNTWILLAIPFGISWVVIGYVLRSGRGEWRARRAPSGVSGFLHHPMRAVHGRQRLTGRHRAVQRSPGEE